MQKLKIGFGGNSLEFGCSECFKCMRGERHLCAVDSHTTIPRKSITLTTKKEAYQFKVKTQWEISLWWEMPNVWENMQIDTQIFDLSNLSDVSVTRATKKSRHFATLPISNFHFRSITCFNTQINNKKTLFWRRTGNLMIVFFLHLHVACLSQQNFLNYFGWHC